jgi:hypothetical protein
VVLTEPPAKRDDNMQQRTNPGSGLSDKNSPSRIAISEKMITFAGYV